ncbi:MAG: Chromosome partition protein Smc [Candidatus Thorarchaeota archaeon]|nr:MAG: Chromosome partition protein Smc [Candidatus Thorarchaeota archaeon]
MVHIEKLVVKGFKSFGRDTVTIKINPGFTCVVGPNGSGKSNVIDAILFVLGQLSAKTLRANVFSDLLYSPPKAGMPPKAKSASVAIHFNNKDRKLQVDADKVVVERELDETGKSTCRVNGKVVTRSAVLDLLGSIGVDPNGYNLVLQGEIAQMVKVSPNDRRKLIEEIAGISAYDEQKDRALKKLAESEQNLGKVETQLQERRRQLERLEEERSDALRYTELKKKIQQVRVNNLAWTIIKSDLRIETIKETLSERAVEAESLEREFHETEEKIAETETKIEEIDSLIDQITGGDSARISERFGVVSAAVSHVESDLSRAQKELNQTKREHEDIQAQLQSIQGQIEFSEGAAKEKDKILAALDEEIAKCKADVSSLEETLAQEQSDFYETQQQLQDLNNQMIALDEGVSEIRSAIKSDNRELGFAYEELSDAEETLKTTKEELIKLQETFPKRKKAYDDMLEEEKSLQTELNNILERQKTIDSEVTESARLVNSTREELIRLQARQDALQEAEDAFLKKRRALARVLEMRDTGEIEGIYGTIAELGTIDPNYSTALEVAGGGRLTHIVVEDDFVASECVRALKRERVGRASFIPLNKIRSRPPGELPNKDGVIGFALDLVDFELKFQPAFEYAFTDTVVTEDFETAKILGFSRWRAVSLDGDLVEKSGLITGGHYQNREAGISFQVEDRSQEIEEKLRGLEEILSDLRNKQESMHQQRRSLQKEIEKLSKESYREGIEIERLEESLQAKEFKKHALTEKIAGIKIRIEELEKQIKDLSLRDRELSEQRERVRERRDHCNELLAKSDAAKINQDIKDLKEILEHHRRQREDIQSEITSLRVGLDERLGPKSVELEHRLQSLNAVIPNLEGDVQVLEKSLEDKESELEELRTERAKIDDAVKDKRVDQVRMKEDLRNLRFRMEEIRDEQTSNEKSVYRLQTEQSRLETDIVALKAELEILADVEQEIAQRANLPELTYREIEDLEEKIRELERELDEMGPVNLKSLTDYDIEREKYDEIVEKKVQLEEEHKEIIAFMEELEREKTQKFLHVYNEIADNFSRVFAKLSPGGEANLMLENPEHPLMGGITVRSKPRGKDVVTLDAMSGGEKTLTGLALIFAIQMFSPASFYVFDEIDAALDSVNAHNVAMLISEMSKSSQFIVVSLREPTVRKADLLIGVSNQDGISRIVSVDLEEVASTA